MGSDSAGGFLILPSPGRADDDSSYGDRGACAVRKYTAVLTAVPIHTGQGDGVNDVSLIYTVCM